MCFMFLPYQVISELNWWEKKPGWLISANILPKILKYIKHCLLYITTKLLHIIFCKKKFIIAALVLQNGTVK